MKSISATIDKKNPNTDKILKYLSNYDHSTEIYNGDFTADWLLTDIHASQWLLKTNKTIKIKKTGKYKYVNSLNWHRKLPDGTYLDSPENLKVLHFFQKILFVLCESKVVMKNCSHSSSVNIFNALMPFIQWCFREDINLNPRSHFLSKLTQRRLLFYFKEQVEGGSFKTYGTELIFKSKFNQLSGYKITSLNILKLNNNDKDKVLAFLKENDFYKVGPRGVKIVDREKFFQCFHLPEQLSYLHRTTAFFRQFEPDYLRVNSKVLIPLKSENEFPGHTTPLIKEIINSNETVGKVIGVFKGLFSLTDLFPDKLPNTNRFKFNTISIYIKNSSNNSKLTPLIPLQKYLFMINSAIRIIINHGNYIIDAIIDIYDTLLLNNLLNFQNNKSRVSTPKQAEQRNLIISNIIGTYRGKIPSLSLNYQKRNHVELRKAQPLIYLLEVLLGACYLTIASFKPMRVNELNSLKYDCLYFKEDDGFWLMQDIEKGGIEGILPEDAKPIPKIAATAITLLQRLNDHARKHIQPSQESKYLTYFIHYGSSWKEASIVDHNSIRNRLATFCDHIEIPLDEYGRRWYANVHELRKSFLLNFFWVYKFSSLDSARWMAGHTHSDHLFHYITSNFEGEEMSEVESEYAYQQLRIFREGNKLSDINNIEDLNNDVCLHFKVKSTSEVKDSELKEWLNVQIESGKYEIYAYCIDNLESSENSKIAIKII